jgi:hypothetical protein
MCGVRAKETAFGVLKYVVLRGLFTNLSGRIQESPRCGFLIVLIIGLLYQPNYSQVFPYLHNCIIANNHIFAHVRRKPIHVIK